MEIKKAGPKQYSKRQTQQPRKADTKADTGFAGVGAVIAGLGMAGLGLTTKMSLDAARGIDRVGKKYYSNQSGTIKKSDKPDIVVK